MVGAGARSTAFKSRLMKTKTAGETLFAEYLKARGLTFRYEDPEIESRKKPDYLVFSDPKVVCEVEDLCENDVDKHAAAALARGEAVVEWSDSTTRAREKIIKGAKQLREHKGTHPCVVVLHNTSATGVHLLDIWVRAAMFGKAQIAVPIDRGDGRPLPEARMVNQRRSRKLTRHANTTLSAVAVLERIQPNRHLITEHLEQLALESTEAIVRATYQFLDAHPEVQAEALRLRVIHNPFARIPLPRHVFSGPHDEHQA